MGFRRGTANDSGGCFDTLCCRRLQVGWVEQVSSNLGYRRVRANKEMMLRRLENLLNVCDNNSKWHFLPCNLLQRDHPFISIDEEVKHGFTSHQR
mmetsp:Transcript_33442/g.49330  ORF Transcript_33442/g.49330 Transcript_33442/m.49330 type:complete len:95 (-) Transcript_33442:50-334(-)